MNVIQLISEMICMQQLAVNNLVFSMFIEVCWHCFAYNVGNYMFIFLGRYVPGVIGRQEGQRCWRRPLLFLLRLNSGRFLQTLPQTKYMFPTGNTQSVVFGQRCVLTRNVFPHSTTYFLRHLKLIRVVPLPSAKKRRNTISLPGAITS